MALLEMGALDRLGWVAIPGLLTPGEAASIAQRCRAALAVDRDVRPGDKFTSGTRRVASLLDRLPEIAVLFDRPELRDRVTHLIGRAIPVSDVAFRCPQPGFGQQSLHTDDLPIGAAGECRAVTSIVALCDFTSTNGATAVVSGSHRRPDLQRRAKRLDLRDAEVVLAGTAGTAFLFSAHLLHRGTLNRSDQPRPALQAQWRLGGPPAGG